MTLIDLDRTDVQNYINKDGLITVSDLRMLALTDDYVEVDHAIDIIHTTMLEFFDTDNEERPMNDKEKLLLSVNKTICNNLKSLKGGETENEDT